MGQTVLYVLDQNLLQTLENATQIKKQSLYILRAIWVKFCCLRFCFLNAFEIENSISLWWNIIKTSCGQYGSNRIVCIVFSWLEFTRNITKFNIDWTICNADKDLSKFTKWTMWISPYCHWLKFFKNILSSYK